MPSKFAVGPQVGCAHANGILQHLGDMNTSKVVNQHTELEHTPKRNLYQQAIIRDSFHNWLGGYCLGCALRVCCNFLGIHRSMDEGMKMTTRDTWLFGYGCLFFWEG